MKILKLQLVCFLLVILGTVQTHAQSARPVNEIYIGTYNLSFGSGYEAKVTVDIPDGFRNNFVGWSPSSWPSNRYGIIGFTMQPFHITRYQYLGSTIELYVDKNSGIHDIEDGEKIQLVIDTNKRSNSITGGYYYLVADIIVTGL